MRILSAVSDDADPGGPSDEWLVGRVAGGDQAAFARLYDRYVRRVYAFAAHVLRPGPAEEVVQDVFVSLWRSADRYEADRGPFATWFMAIARHRVVDELRRRTVEQRVFAAEPVEELLSEVAASLPEMADDIARRERDGVLLRAIADLPLQQRRAIVLAYFAGLTHVEIAAALGCPLGTVKKRLRLGLRKLHERVDEKHPAEASLGSAEWSEA